VPHRLPARAVDEPDMGLAGREKIILTPLAQGDEQREQGPPLAGEPVFQVSAVGGRHGLENPVIEQIAQPRGQNVLGQSQAALEFAEALQAAEAVAHDQQRPAVADRIQRTRHPARHILVAGALDHRSSSLFLWLHLKTIWRITQMVSF